MHITHGPWLSLLLVALFGGALALRTRWPNASRGAENAVLFATVVLFFTIVNGFLR